MLSRILVGVDDSEYGEKAFDFAVLIAKRFESRLLIAHIIEELGNIGQSVVNELEQDSQRILFKHQSKAHDLGLSSSEVNVIEDRGINVAEKILEIAEKERTDAIVVGSRGRYSSSETFLLGSTSSKLVHYGKHTVIVVK